jgi:hypothetical protein
MRKIISSIIISAAIDSFFALAAAVEKLLFPLTEASASRAAVVDEVLCCSCQFDLVV